MVRQEKNEEAIFSSAIEFENRDEQDAYLAKACGDDKKLRADVEALLKAHYEGGSLLDVPAFGTGATLGEPPLAEGPGTKVGRYKLLQMIGEGGFACVYMAEQEQPVRRKVALKIIKLGMDTKQVIGRFEAERQALALMDHPNIAKVFDGGATDTGRPYFVMELVKGIPITEYCDDYNFDTRSRLELFVGTCRAVQHAHQKGIIHRDIKPSNVMVTLRDGRPIPKVIDFGIAKAMQQRLTERTVFTEYRQFLGTPEYMSPEQAQYSELDVDTRTDIYSLGVLLYELLTGTTPLERKELQSGSYDEMLKIIRETDPPKPSTRVSTLGDALAEVAKHRHAEPAELCKIIRGDLDWVVMKTLEKDRTRRYETVNELAMDIERHLVDEPVSASPPSAGYRLRKFVRRHRTSVVAGLLVAAALVIGLCLATVGFVQASREKARTERALQLAGMNFAMARDAVEEMTKVAEQKLANAPGMEQVRRELLQKAQVFYEGFLERNSSDPATREEIGRAYQRLGDIHFRALNQCQPAVEAYQNALNVFVSLARDYPHVDNYARIIVEVTLEYSAALGQGGFYEEAPDTVLTLTTVLENLVWQFPDQPLYRQRLVDDCVQRGTREALEYAISLLESVLPDHPASGYELARALIDLGHLLKDQGLQEEADRAYQRAEAIRVELVALLPDLPYESRRTCNPWAKAAMCSVRYKVRIKSAGDYQLIVRCDAHDGPSDSFYAWIEEFVDGPGGTIVDWYTYGVIGGDADFASFGWQGSAGFEATWHRRDPIAAIWYIPDPGDYTITFAAREDGIAIDAFVFQLASLPAPEGDGPAESEITEETVLLESDGRVVAEAEHFRSRTAIARDWRIVPDEDPGDTDHLNFRGNGYIQALPDRTPCPQPGTIWVMRGYAQSELENWEQAFADYSKAIELNPNNSYVWYSRGRAHAELGQFENAVVDFTKAIELNPDYVRSWYYNALLQLYAGEVEGYHDTCTEMLDYFGQTKDASIAYWVTWTCVLGRDAVEDLGHPVELAEMVVESDDENHRYLSELGAILYRAGWFAEAIEQLSVFAGEWEEGKELPTITSPSYTWFFMAMAHHQLGNSDEATMWLGRAVERAEEELAGTPSWNRKLTLQLFREEAESLIK